jgi:hypothetical protein
MNLQILRHSVGVKTESDPPTNAIGPEPAMAADNPLQSGKLSDFGAEARASSHPLSCSLRSMITIPGRAFLAVIAGGLIAQAGCARSASPNAGHPTPESSREVLPAGKAAELAARLANEQCQRQYRSSPFKPQQHEAILQEGMYRWGGLDVGAPGGFSALVTFRQDGSEGHVEVYYSTDALKPPGEPDRTPPRDSPEPR